MPSLYGKWKHPAGKPDCLSIHWVFGHVFVWGVWNANHNSVDIVFLADHAQGMAYLHNCNPVIKHLDLKPDNCLVAQAPIRVCCLASPMSCDFLLL